MKTAGQIRWLVAAGALALASASASAAPTPQQIIEKGQARINSAKTYQVTYQMTQTMGAMGSMKMTMNIKAIPGKKMWMNTTPTGMMMVDDGKTMYRYIAPMKQYIKGPSQAAKSMQLGVSQAAMLAKQMNLKLGAPASVSGKSCYVIEMTPKKAQPGQSMLLKFYFDQATYAMVKMAMTGSGAARPGQPVQSMQVNMVAVSEKINAPIPDSVFKFTPPAGATEMKPGGAGPMGGMGGPGGLGGPGGPRR